MKKDDTHRRAAGHSDREAGPRDRPGRGRTASSPMGGLLGILAIAATVTAVVTELRTPAERRTWNGHVWGGVPYDFRPPTAQRWRDRMWTPQNPVLLSPTVVGVGWTVNIGRLVELLRRRGEAAAPPA